MRRTYLFLGLALVLVAVGALDAHALAAHPIIIDKGLVLADGTNSTGVRAIMDSIPDVDREQYLLIRVHDKPARSILYRGDRYVVDVVRWNNGRLDVYARNMTRSQLQEALVRHGLRASTMTTMPSSPGKIVGVRNDSPLRLLRGV